MKNYSAGTFLYGIPSSEVSASYHPEDQRVFLYDGCNTADGYGILTGICRAKHGIPSKL